MDFVDSEGIGYRGKERDQDDHGCVPFDEHPDYQKEYIDDQEEDILVADGPDQPVGKLLGNPFLGKHPGKDGGCRNDQQDRGGGGDRLGDCFPKALEIEFLIEDTQDNGQHDRCRACLGGGHDPETDGPDDDQGDTQGENGGLRCIRDLLSCQLLGPDRLVIAFLRDHGDKSHQGDAKQGANPKARDKQFSDGYVGNAPVQDHGNAGGDERGND